MGSGLLATLDQSIQISKPERTFDYNVPNIWQLTVVAADVVWSFQDK